jgi:hypothetical protein
MQPPPPRSVFFYVDKNQNKTKQNKTKENQTRKSRNQKEELKESKTTTKRNDDVGACCAGKKVGEQCGVCS